MKMKKVVGLGVCGAVALCGLWYLALGWVCDVRSDYEELWFLDFRSRIEVDIDKDGRMDYAERAKAPFLQRFTDDKWNLYRQKADGSFDLVFEMEGRPVAFVEYYKDKWKAILLRVNAPFFAQYVCYKYAPDITEDEKKPYYPISNMVTAEERFPNWTLSENPFDYPALTPPLRKFLWIYEQTLLLDFVENGLPVAYTKLPKDELVDIISKRIREWSQKYKAYVDMKEASDEQVRSAVQAALDEFLKSND